jgi:hypothetical protein
LPSFFEARHLKSLPGIWTGYFPPREKQSEKILENLKDNAPNSRNNKTRKRKRKRGFLPSRQMAQVECPVCSRTFAEDAIESHVLQCLDEQQYKEDEKLARQLERSSNSSSSSARSLVPRVAIPVARVGRARGPAAAAAATGLDVNRPHDGVLGTLKTDPTNTLLAGTDAKEALLELLEERHQLGYPPTLQPFPTHTHTHHRLLRSSLFRVACVRACVRLAP